MEDYLAAFLQRIEDVVVLDKGGRRVAAIHFGGIAIECLLKHIILSSLPEDVKKEWKTDNYDPGHTITNPKHDFSDALNRYNRLRSRFQQFPPALKWLNDVENPRVHFIDFRYLGDELDNEKYKKWLQSYTSLVDWLQKEATVLALRTRK